MHPDNTWIPSGLQAAGITKQPAATLHILPLCELPFLEALLTPTWHLPNDRDQQQHHLFPVPLPVSLTSKSLHSSLNPAANWRQVAGAYAVQAFVHAWKRRSTASLLMQSLRSI